jgi:hypothetical protein
MKGVAFCLCLLLAVPAAANSLDEALCRTTSLPVARMEDSEKLCRSFARSLAALPEAMTQEARNLLTPENIAVMAAMTAAWVGTQGVPVVGQAVDAALLALGVTLLVAQTGELVDALWAYVNRAIAARSKTDLDEAARHLARALSMAGINVVAFILTKKAVSKAPRGPSSPSMELGVHQVGKASVAMGGPASSAARAPAVPMVGGPGRSGKPSRFKAHSSKKPVHAAFKQWVRKAQRRPPQERPEKALAFQRKHAGAEEILVEGGGVKVWADGARASDAHLIDTKYVEKPGVSPFIDGSACDEAVRQIIRHKEAGQFSRYAAVISDPATPAIGLEVIVNDARAVPFFEALLAEFGIPGQVVIKSE